MNLLTKILVFFFIYGCLAMTFEDPIKVVVGNDNSANLSADEPKVSVGIQGSTLSIRKGMTNLNLTVYSYAEVTNQIYNTYMIFQIGFRRPGKCYCYNNFYKTGSYNLTSSCSCNIPGPINENMTIDVYTYGSISDTGSYLTQ